MLYVLVYTAKVVIQCSLLFWFIQVVKNAPAKKKAYKLERVKLFRDSSRKAVECNLKTLFKLLDNVSRTRRKKPDIIRLATNK